MKLDVDLNLLPVLEALIDEGSVTQAARTLGITQSAASYALRRLRSHLGDELLVRSGNRMLPTPRLLALAPMINSVMGNLREGFGSSATFDPVKSTRTFTISTTEVGELTLIPQLISELDRVAPGVALRVVSLKVRDALSGLESGDVDVWVGVQNFDGDGLITQVLQRSSLIFISGRNSKWSEGCLSDPAQLAEIPHIAISPFSEGDDAYEPLFAANGVQRHFRRYLTSFAAAAALVAHSDLIATVPDRLLGGMQYLPSFKTGSLPFMESRPVSQTWHVRFQSDPASIWFRKIVASLLSNQQRSQEGHDFQALARS